MRRMDLRHSRFITRMRREPKKYTDSLFESYRKPNFPKIIWLYWNVGEQNAPFLIRQCIESWRSKNPGWDVRVLSDKSLPEGVSLDDVPAFYEPVKRANVLRLRLLKRYGGVWCDATVYCHRSLDTYLDQFGITGFFCLRDDGPCRDYSNWFMACEADDPIISALEHRYCSDIANSWFSSDIWFTFFFTHQWIVSRNPDFARRLDEAPTLQARPSFLMMSVLKRQHDKSQLVEMLDCGLTASKLDFKHKVSEAEVRALMEFVEDHCQNTGGVPR